LVRHQLAQIVNLNPDPNGTPWLTGGVPILTPEIQAIIDATSVMVRQSFLDPPEAIDNSQNDFMPPIFLQEHGCCAQASGVGYVFTYEMNWLRNLSGDVLENQYPTHFTYNFLNNGNPNHGSIVSEGWDIIMENGCPSVQTYGGMCVNNDPTYWMTGYDNYSSALQNTIETYSVIDLENPENGLADLKQWLFNHNDDNETYGGLASFSTNMDACEFLVIQPPLPELGKKYLNEYSNPQDQNHQLTIVGYDDNICLWDINGDGFYTNDQDVDGDGDIDLFDYEKGAFKVANSWDINWPNPASEGFVYWPYKFLAYKASAGFDNPFIGDVAHIVHPFISYEPELFLKVELSHPSRKRINVGAHFG
jgi:hypothetical protein